VRQSDAKYSRCGEAKALAFHRLFDAERPAPAAAAEPLPVARLFFGRMMLASAWSAATGKRQRLVEDDVDRVVVRA